MRINEILSSLSIYMNNEESAFYEALGTGKTPMNLLDERQQTIALDLIRKSLLTKIVRNGNVLIQKNESTST